MGFPDAFRQISSLVNDFKENEKHYLNPSYSEADVRNDFINKFFIALGWDVRHEIQKNPYEQEVRVEKAVTVAKAQKRADYTFYLAPNFRDVKFFVEAKKPSHDLENKDYFFQTVRYGWNANTPVAVLSDFEEFIILDCRFRPDINEILNYRIKIFHYSDYADEEKLKEIYYLFSREAVGDNSIEKFAEGLPKPRGKKKTLVKAKYQNIDEAFLEELDEVRTRLAKSFKKNNTHLSSDELTEATQRTIDRLVFIKFLEDKMIEPHHYVSEFVKPHPNPSPYKGEGLLDSLSLSRRGTKDEVEGKADSVSAWEKFLRASRALDAKYNGVVFKKSLIDSRNLVEPDDKTFSSICDDLSHENSPYNFDAIPIHILGSIYERFLGKVVNATDKRVTIEEKPEVRKAGGVYYTPQYIVNYIVDNTVVKLIEGKTPKEIAKMRFADIACGSGSFLITVYERLIDYHKQWYQQHPEQAKKDGCILYEGAYRLSLQQKQKILLNNIYGVDLDQQAVEVTQLSLYLKLLEDETTATANDTWVMFKEQILPDLNKNIICGNSLIGTDILNLSLQFPLLGKERGRGEVDELKLKPMDFENVFPDIMKSGGFDAIVGNPPYVLSREVMDTQIKEYYSKQYMTLWEKPNTFNLFLERAFSLISNKGLLSYIIPNSWLTIESCKLSRKHFITKNSIRILDDLNYNVFKNVGVEPLIILLSKKSIGSKIEYRRLLNTKDMHNPYIKFDQNSWNNAKNNYSIYLSAEPAINILLDKILKRSSIIGELYDVRTGLQAYEYNKGKPKQSKNDVKSRIYDYNYKFDNQTYKYLVGKNVERYAHSWSKNYLRYGEWLSQPRTIDIFSRPRILLREITSKPPYTLLATYIDEVYLNNKSILNILEFSDSIDNLKFLLAQLNSKLISFYYKCRAVKSSRKLFPKVVIKDLRRFPTLSMSDNSSVKKIICLVDQILTTKKQLQEAKTEGDKNYLQRKCDRLDREIDELVYQLYGLTEEEIKIVEGN
ncbi:MAG: N-6 DNA methylase [Ignavibacterium sp.]|nr:N-6 DNA methylase [Ignavibacterium sp.]